MIFNDPTNNQGIVQDINHWTKADDNTYPLADKVRNCNRALDKISARIIRNSYNWTFVDDNSTDFSIAFTTLPAGLDNVAMEIDHLNLERVRIKNTDGTYTTLTPRARREIPDWVLDSTGRPEYYYRQGQSLVFAPSADQTYELELEFQKGMDYFSVSDTTKQPGFNPQFHRLVSLYASRDYVGIDDQRLYEPIQMEIRELEAEMDEFYQKRTRDEITSLSVAGRRVFY
jgi:hypothetical protein